MQASNILLEKLPSQIKIYGAEYQIDADFRTAIRFTLLMQDRAIDDYTKLGIALYMFLGDADIPDYREAIDAILRFYQRGKSSVQGNAEMASTRRNYDFEYDADLIYAAFLEQYGLDLQNVEFLHWWQFRALFSGLSEKTEFMKVVSYRAIEITNDMTKAQKRFYKKMKMMYALPDTRTEEEKEKDFATSLLKI